MFFRRFEPQPRFVIWVLTSTLDWELGSWKPKIIIESTDYKKRMAAPLINHTSDNTVTPATALHANIGHFLSFVGVQGVTSNSAVL